MKIDLHCHTKYSGDNYLEPEELIEQALKMNLDGVCITEHSSLLDARVIDRIKVPEGFYVFRGIELYTSHGHLLVYGLKEDSWDAWYSHNDLALFHVLEKVHKHGGICVPAHPFRGWDSFAENVLKIDGIDAIETHNGLDGEEKNRKARRILDAIEEMGELDNTLVIYIQGDNGASAEGGPQGLLNELTYFNGIPESFSEVIKRMDELGGPNTYNHYPIGWAHAMDTPFQWTKQVASHFGGTRNGLVIS